ncbi:MAG TPA: hypothetical protein VGO52_19235 [Hyphomonadaceae bacterium]|jgi:hypothetical protein|nr:hypothetical protein [Hyphomonadaceae bacterium]
MKIRSGMGPLGIVALALAACSMGNGVWRKGAVAQIDEACAEGAIKAADGIEVIAAQDNEQKSYELTGKKTVLTSRNILYHFPDGRQAGFSMTRSNQEANVVIQHVWGKQSGERISADEAQSAVRAMLDVERAVENACKVEIVMSTTCSDSMDCKAVQALVAEHEA